MNVENAYPVYIQKFDKNNYCSVRVDYYRPGDHILVGYDDGSDYCKDSRHPLKYANGTVVSALHSVLVVNDCGKDIPIEFGWIVEVQDGTLPACMSHRVK